MRKLGDILAQAKSLGDEIETGGDAASSPIAVAKLLAALSEVHTRLAFLVFPEKSSGEDVGLRPPQEPEDVRLEAALAAEEFAGRAQRERAAQKCAEPKLAPKRSIKPETRHKQIPLIFPDDYVGPGEKKEP